MSTNTLASPAARMTDVLRGPNLRQGFLGKASQGAHNRKPTRRQFKRRIAQDGLTCDPELCFVDDGYTGESLIRPCRWTGSAISTAAGAIDRVYVLCPDRLARKYAYQVLIVDELVRWAASRSYLSHQSVGQ